MEDQEIEAYMRAFDEMNQIYKKIEQEQLIVEKLPRDQFGPRMAHMQMVARMTLDLQKNMLAQMTRMNNIFSQAQNVPDS